MCCCAMTIGMITHANTPPSIMLTLMRSPTIMPEPIDSRLYDAPTP